jgi:hypothetical protein
LLSFWQFIGRVGSIRFHAHFTSNRHPWRFAPLIFTSLGKLEGGKDQKQKKKAKKKQQKPTGFHAL